MHGLSSYAIFFLQIKPAGAFGVVDVPDDITMTAISTAKYVILCFYFCFHKSDKPLNSINNLSSPRQTSAFACFGSFSFAFEFL
ncbi:unnamed protein product [Auanema sp. JU1783]|nr:unnamed protein product [Auanema sp. JU1783]